MTRPREKKSAADSLGYKSMLFDVPGLRIVALESGRCRYGHTFGGPAAHKGAKPRGAKRAFHLLYSLNLDDPALKVGPIPGVQMLPLYHPLAYEGNPLAYHVISDREIRVLELDSTNTSDSFPRDAYPADFPQRPIRLRQLPFDPGRPQDVHRFDGVFGYGWVPRKSRKHFYDYLARDHREMRYLRRAVPRSLAKFDEGADHPFVQGSPRYNYYCKNPECPNPAVYKEMDVLAIIVNEPVRGLYLWDKHSFDVWIVFTKCRHCHSIFTYNECT